LNFKALSIDVAFDCLDLKRPAYFLMNRSI